MVGWPVGDPVGALVVLASAMLHSAFRMWYENFSSYLLATLIDSVK